MESSNTLKDIENFIKARRGLFQVRSKVYEGIIKVDEYSNGDLKIEFYYCDERLRHVVIKSKNLNISLSEQDVRNIRDIINYLKKNLE